MQMKAKDIQIKLDGNCFKLAIDLYDYFIASVDGELSSMPLLSWKDQFSVCVVLASNGYPGSYPTNDEIINLIDEPGKVSSGSVMLGNLNIHEDPNNIVKYRGKKIGLIFQDPQTSLNPILTVGEQLIETIQTHLDLNKEEAKQKAINLMKIIFTVHTRRCVHKTKETLCANVELSGELIEVRKYLWRMPAAVTV